MVSYTEASGLKFCIAQWLRYLTVALLPLFFFPVVTAEESVKAELASAQLLLQRMAEANKRLNYKGTFTYEYGGVLKSAKVVHMVKEGREYERLFQLSGPANEVIRRGNEINCLRAGDKLLRGLLRLDGQTRRQFPAYYDLYIRGDGRVAGRPVTEIHVVPRDQYRYGYSLAMDKETGLLLQSLLVGQGKNVLERFQFIDIHVGVLFDEMEVMPGQPDHYVAGLDHSPCVEDALPHYQGKWRAGWLPPGFVLTGEERDETLRRNTLIFTDGLAVFSVFIDDDQQLNMPEVQAQRGATVAFLMHYSSRGPRYSVGVVGEIPPATARRVAQSITLIP